jgi:drug/metabolite transporter (DMT)-like permease
VLAIGLAVPGAVLLGVGDSGGGGLTGAAFGNSLALTASLLVSIYMLIGRVVRQRTTWLAYVFPLYVVVALTTLAAAALRSTPLFGYEPAFYGLCALMALGPQVLGHGSFNFALKFFPAALLGLLTLLEPVGASIIAYFLFHEEPGRLALIGMVVVMASVAYAIVPRKRVLRRMSTDVQAGTADGGTGRNRAAGSSSKRLRRSRK